MRVSHLERRVVISRCGYSRAPLKALGLAATVLLASGCERAVRQDSLRPATDMVCPAAEFARFLEAFAEGAEVQRAFTRSPLVRRHVDKSASPEPTPVEARLALHEVAFPVFPNAEERGRQGRTLKVRELTSDRASVVVGKEDTDFQTVFLFERGECWRLVLVDDQSL